MNYITTIQRINVSPSYLEDKREEFFKLEYLNPRKYTNASRYKNLRRIQEQDTKKIHHETPIQKFVDTSENDQYLTVDISNADRLDIISNIYYGTPKYWWVIAQANYILDPFDVPVGTYLRIPQLIALYNVGGILSGN